MTLMKLSADGLRHKSLGANVWVAKFPPCWGWRKMKREFLRGWAKGRRTW